MVLFLIVHCLYAPVCYSDNLPGRILVEKNSKNMYAMAVKMNQAKARWRNVLPHYFVVA